MPLDSVQVSQGNEQPRSSGLISFIRGRFIAGVLILAPFLLTYIVFTWLFDLGADVFGPLFEDWFGYNVPGLGFAVILLGPLLIGIIALHFVGQRALIILEAGVARIPILGPVFVVLQQFTAAFGSDSEAGFNRVVEIEYPRPGAWTFGFLTGFIEHENGTQMGVVYVPTAPAPNSGWLAIVPLEDIYDLDISGNQVMRYVLSAGVAAPARVKRTQLDPGSVGGTSEEGGRGPGLGSTARRQSPAGSGR